MALVWKTSGKDNVCSRCRNLNGRRDGDGWDSTRPAGYHPDGTMGPPPRHDECACTAEEETTREWIESIQPVDE